MVCVLYNIAYINCFTYKCNWKLTSKQDLFGSIFKNMYFLIPQKLLVFSEFVQNFFSKYRHKINTQK